MFKTAKDLENEISAKLDRVVAIAEIAKSENRQYSQEESAEVEAVNASVEADKKALELQRKVEANILARGRSEGVAKIEANREGSEGQKPIRVPAKARSGNRLVAFNGPNGEADAYASGRFLMATIANHSESKQWCRDHGVITNAMGENDDLKGGYIVPHQMESAIVNLKESYGVFGQNVRSVPMVSDTMSVPRRLSGLTAYAVTEAQEITASDATFSQVNLTAKKFGTLTRISSELSEDAIISIADYLVGEIAYAHAVKEDACGFLGDGGTTYHGITGLANALAAGSIATAASGQNTAAGLTIAVFQDAVAKVPQYPGIMPKWFVNSAVYWNVMARLQLAAGGNNVVDLGSGPVMQFMGYPVVFAQTLPATIGASTKFAYFGDLMLAATKGNRRGVTIAADSSRYFEYDQTAIRSTLRYDINVHEIGTASAGGPVISLVSAS